MTTYAYGHLSEVTLEMGWGVHDQLMGGLLVTSGERNLYAFRLSARWSPEDGERRYDIYRKWNDFTGEVEGKPHAWCYERDIRGLL